MKTKTMAVILTLGLASKSACMASVMEVTTAGYSFSGSWNYYSSGGKSNMYQNGLGAGYYRYGYLNGKVINKSANITGTIVCNLWVSDYIGATSGRVTYTAGWGNNSQYRFSGYQSWTCTKYGYRKQLNRYGYSSFGVHEYTGSWPMRDELDFTSSYGKW